MLKLLNHAYPFFGESVGITIIFFDNISILLFSSDFIFFLAIFFSADLSFGFWHFFFHHQSFFKILFFLLFLNCPKSQSFKICSQDFFHYHGFCLFYLLELFQNQILIQFQDKQHIFKLQDHKIYQKNFQKTHNFD